ncbi:MAG: helix-turn-helix transcriptional regulator [Planctomycetes bacterium]|nr:helix-turn-helix transcriptional regulator [Planctomycetota bacterium]
MTDAVHCRVLSCNQVTIGTSWNHRLCNPFWRLYINDADGAWIKTATGVFAIPARKPVLLPPWGDFDGRCSRTLGHVYIHFDVHGMPPQWIRKNFHRPVVAVSAIVPSRIAHASGAAGLALPSSRLRAQSLACDALAAALDQLPEAAIAMLHEHVTDGDPLGLAVRHIEELLASHLEVSALARLCHLSTDHFSLLFKRRFGQTPARYIQERRIERAAERLLTTDEDISAIAAACGFANRYHFTRVFALRMSCAPANYRRQGRVSDQSSS